MTKRQLQSKRKSVYIVTFCDNLDYLYASTLIFKTLRMGFPTAEVHVIDNHSLPKAARHIQGLAEENECQFRRLPSVADQPRLLADMILNSGSEGTVVFLHPDICFWKNCENWSFDKLIAGRFLPMFLEANRDSIMMPSLHSHFWWIENIKLFRERIVEAYSKNHVDPLAAFSLYAYRLNGRWHRFDLGAGLYNAVREDVYCFGDKELDCYDHLYGGSYYELIIQVLDEEGGKMIERAHACARSDYRQLRGLWKIQEEYLKKRAIADPYC
jgi:hypothetical protein